MKTTVILGNLLIMAVIVLNFTANAQIKVISGGNVGIGLSSPEEKLHIEGALKVGASSNSIRIDNAGTYFQWNRNDNLIMFASGGANATLSFGIQTNYWDTPDMKILNNGNVQFFNNVGIGTSTPSAKLQVTGGNLLVYDGSDIILKDDNAYDPGDLIFQAYDGSEFGRIYSYSNIFRIRARSGSNGDIRIKSYNGHVAILYEPQDNFQFYVAGSAYCTGSWQSSDAKLKKDIASIDNSLDKVKKLNGVSYNFKTEEYDSLNLPEGKNYGLIAQEVKEIIPELVKEDDKGFSAINYDGFIPFLIEAIKQQQTEIENLKAKVENKNANIPGGTDNKTGSNVTNAIYDNELNGSKAKLYQNNPNPFSVNTEIGFSIPDDVKSASLLIFNMEGVLLKTIEIHEKGNGSITIFGGTMKPGMYLYSLVTDNKEVDTKRMILTE